MRKRIFTLAAATAFAVAAFGAPAAAFSPPGQGDAVDDVFGTAQDPADFPGAVGQSRASNLGAWNGHIHGGPVEL